MPISLRPLPRPYLAHIELGILASRFGEDVMRGTVPYNRPPLPLVSRRVDRVRHLRVGNGGINRLVRLHPAFQHRPRHHHARQQFSQCVPVVVD